MARWIALAALVAAFLLSQQLISTTPTHREQVEAVKPPALKPPLYDATRAPGRVVVLDTKKGRIEFVLFEKDCPVTTRRVADLATCGAYDGAKFPRVEEPLVQSSGANARTRPIIVELTKELKNIPGAVGMARAEQYDSAASSFYILKAALPELDGEYTIFGQVIRGLDVVAKLQKDDVIQSAAVRPHTFEDVRILNQAKLTKLDREPRPLDPEFVKEPEHDHEEGDGCPSCGG